MEFKEGLFGVYFLIGMGYIFYNTFGKFSLDPTEQPYNKLFDNKTFFRHFIFSIILTAISLPIMKNYDNRAAMLTAPMIFLIILKGLNGLLKNRLGRNIMLAAGHDTSSIQIKLEDRLSMFIVLTTSIIIPGLIMNYFRVV
jgi:hypothetical protein